LNRHPDRLPILLAAGAALQDQDPESGTYGNFRWYNTMSRVGDTNAVEFCMLHAVPLYIRHREMLTEESIALLRATLERGVHGCLTHWIPLSYTNIGFMRAANLIMLGEALEMPEVAQAGYQMLDGVTDYIHHHGIHEYVSPTYHGVALGCLHTLDAFAQTERVRQQVRAMLELFWTDIALNWHPGAGRLAGAYSRTYRYVTGGGNTDNYLQAAGWLDPGRARGIAHAFIQWQPPQELWELSNTRFPRLVRQSWGPSREESRTAYLCKDIVLSTSGALYDVMDQPLTVDFATRPGMPRAYFIADGREDPYGDATITAGTHQKAQHLRCDWMAAQRGHDALAAAFYRDAHWDAATQTLQSHFVMPREVDGIWIGDDAVDLGAAPPWEVPVPSGALLTARDGTASMGIRLVLARGVNGEAAPVHLVHDGNSHGVVRLTVRHARPGEFRGSSGALLPGAVLPGAVWWVRVGSAIESDAAFHAWRHAFAAADARVEEGAAGLRVRVAGMDGPVAVGKASPTARTAAMLPPPAQGVLELDGADIAAAVLAQLPRTQKSELAAR
jgi:hypothetical protein